MFQNLLSRLLTFWPKILFYGLIAIGLLVALSFGKSFIKDRTTELREFQDAVKAGALANVNTRIIPGPERLVVLDKREAVEHLKLDPAILVQPHIEVIDAADVKGNEGGATVAVLMNMTTGKPKMKVEYKKPPFTELLTVNRIGGGYPLVGHDKGAWYGFYERDVVRLFYHGKVRGRVELGPRKDDNGKSHIDPRVKVEAFWEF